MYIKQHPNKIGLKKSEIDENNIPIELLQMLSPLENKVIIALYSNILFTSKLVFNKEPYLIFLYKAIGMNVKNVVKMTEEEFDNANRVILMDAYKDKTKIFIPETLEEYKDCLDYIKKEINKRKA